MGDLDDVCHDDRLIEAAARGEHLDGTDPAAGPLLALSRVADARPLPRLDLDPGMFADPYRNRRYAVRSLAAALATVATLSTSGVAAVVTGDPFRPAKAVWEQIQEHTRHRVHIQGQRPDSDSASVTGRSPASSVSSGPSRPSGAVPAPPPEAPPKEPAGRAVTGQAVTGSEPSAREVAAAPVRPDAAARSERPTSGEPQRTPDARQSGSHAAETRPEQDAPQSQPEERSADSSSEDDAGTGAERRPEGPAYRTEPTPDDDGPVAPDGPTEGDDPDEGDQDRGSEDEDDIAVPFWAPEQRHDEDGPRTDQRGSDGDRRAASVEERATDVSERAEGVAERARDGARGLARMGTSRPPSPAERASPTPRETSTDREEVPWN
ncbi:MAG TPA: hypothetical protein VHG70_17285 [Nocardioidaceae bacterium]|nr:hypothetical protein [Nocardioidaceae bacterium]